MAARQIEGYVRQVNDAVSSGNSYVLAQLLSVWRHPASLPIQIQNYTGDFEIMIDNRVNQPFSEILINYFKILVLISKKRFVDAFPLASNSVHAFLKGFEAWMVPVLNCLCRDLRTISRHADKILVERGEKANKQEDAARTMNKALQITKSDRSRPADLSTSKIYGVLCVANHLFKTHFAANNLKLCRSLIRALEDKTLPELRLFPLSQSVTYSYYKGRLEMFDGDFQKAAASLSFTFGRLPARSTKNKRLTLLFLVPVQLILGQIVKESILKKYKLQQLIGLTRAVRFGNVGAFNEEMQKHQEFFIKTGIFLTLERVKLLVYRNFFKRIFTIQQNTKPALSVFIGVMKSLGIDMDIHQIECILANLIASGQIRGYLSHEKQTLVVSKASPFPPLESLNK